MLPKQIPLEKKSVVSESFGIIAYNTKSNSPIA